MMDPSNPGNYQYHQQQDLLQLLAGSSLTTSVSTPSSFTTTDGSNHDWNPCLLLATDGLTNGNNAGAEEKGFRAQVQYSSSSHNENGGSRSSMNPLVVNPAHAMRLRSPLHPETLYAKIKDESLRDSYIKFITGGDGFGGTTAAEALPVGCSGGNRPGESYYSLVHPTTALDPISSSSSSCASAGFPSIAEFQSALESARVGAGESILVGEAGEDNRDFEQHQSLPCPDQQPMMLTHVKMSSPACSGGGGITQEKKRSSGDHSEIDSKAARPPQKKPRQEPRSSAPPFKVRKEKLGDRIAALQQLVAPFGKTDTASVLMEAIGYIKFLQDQVETLSVPYLRSSRNNKPSQSTGVSDEVTKEKRMDLRSRGLCLVPLSCTSYVTNENVGIWPPDFTGGT